MKVEYLVDFLPADLRRRGVHRSSRRRSGLLIALMTFMVVGVAAHSWNMYRSADLDRAISMQLCTNSTNVDDVVNKLAADQQAITRFLGVYDQITLPLETSDLMATFTHLMPERMSLAMLRLEVQIDQPSAAEAKAQKAAAATAKPTKPGADPKVAPPARPHRWLNATIRGYAASNADLYDFERRLSRTTPLEAVTVTENKPLEVPGAQMQEFAITCRIPLDVRYERSVEAPIATVGQAATEGSTK